MHTSVILNYIIRPDRVSNLDPAGNPLRCSVYCVNPPGQM